MAASRLLSALEVDMLPVVILFSYIKDNKPFKMVPTLHIGFQLSAIAQLFIECDLDATGPTT